MKFASAVIRAILMLGSVRLFSPADSLEIKLNLTGLLADQSSTADHTSFGFGIGYASRAIDGNYNTDFAARSCSHTSETAIGISWWRIDLGQPFKVQRIVIVNRGDCCGYRLNNFVVGLSNSSAYPVRGDYALCGQYPGPAANGANLSLQCHPRTASGSYVIVQQSSDGNGNLTICEIEIYAGQVRNLNRWERLSNQRLISVDAIVLSTRSSTMCVAKCKQTVDCDSANYHQLDKRCEMNFLPPGAVNSHMINVEGWDNWVQMYEFI